MKALLAAAAVAIGFLGIGCGDESCDPAREDCSSPTADAGKPCSDESECEGWCEAPTGAAVGAATSGLCSARTTAPCASSVIDGVYAGEVCQ